MRAIRPLSVMLYVLGYAAVPCWPAGIASAILWTGRAEMAFLTTATTGSFSGLLLLIMAQAERRAAQAERREGMLCGTIAADLRPHGHRPAKTLPLRAVR